MSLQYLPSGDHSVYYTSTEDKQRLLKREHTLIKNETMNKRVPEMKSSSFKSRGVLKTKIFE
jgi:hypothetical protein